MRQPRLSGWRTIGTRGRNGTIPSRELSDWLALIRTPGTGPATQRALLNAFGAPEAVFSAAGARLGEFNLSDDTLAYLRSPERESIQRDLDWLARDHRHLITRDDPRFPPLLAELPDAPVALFVVGDPDLLAEPQLAMVGSRNPSAGGRDTAHAFAAHLSACGLVITSGLATGIDAASHRGALESGTTIAVLGTGPDRIYPARHRALATEIAQKGALVTEFPPGTGPRPEHFPRRNRIISGLALGTLVVEAALRSGSLITARLASEQGREVFAIPGSIHNPLARGCHRLIREGAKLVESASDILEELGPLAGVVFASPDQDARPTRRPATEEGNDPEKEALLKCVGHEPTSIDTIVERAGLSADVVSSMLLILELQGQVAATPGGRYTRVN